MLVSFIKEKEFKDIFKAIGYAFLGAAVVCIPILIYFAAHNNINEFFYAFWTFNVKYSKNIAIYFRLVYNLKR